MPVGGVQRTNYYHPMRSPSTCDANIRAEHVAPEDGCFIGEQPPWEQPDPPPACPLIFGALHEKYRPRGLRAVRHR